MLRSSKLFATLALSFLISMSFAFASENEQAIRAHLARVRDFKERQIQMDRITNDRLKGAQLASDLRKKAEAEREQIRAAFVLSRKTLDPLAEEKREAIWQAEIEKRNAEQLKREKYFSVEQNQIQQALSKLPQIDEMKEYQLAEEAK